MQFSVYVLLLCMASCERGVVTRQVVFSPPGQKTFKCSEAFGKLRAGGSQCPRGAEVKGCNIMRVTRRDVFTKHKFSHALCPLPLGQLLRSGSPKGSGVGLSARFDLSGTDQPSWHAGQDLFFFLKLLRIAFFLSGFTFLQQPP